MSGVRGVGPYGVLLALDGGGGPAFPVAEERFIARSGDGERTVVVSVPGAGVDPVRFRAEAETSRFLLGPWAAGAVEVGEGAGAAWHARPYLPAVSLPTALTVQGGPLPPSTVRAVGAAVAEALAAVHGQGLVHAGVCPAAVLLTADGPQLSNFGAVRAAAGAGVWEAGSVAPELVAGGLPGPQGDMFALGATLAYAATGHTVPEREEVPAELRAVISRCLARDPQARPSAAEVTEALCQVPGAGMGGAVGTVVESYAVSRAGALLGEGWLPARVVAALAHQSATVLAADLSQGVA